MGGPLLHCNKLKIIIIRQIQQNNTNEILTNSHKWPMKKWYEVCCMLHALQIDVHPDIDPYVK